MGTNPHAVYVSSHSQPLDAADAFESAIESALPFWNSKDNKALTDIWVLVTSRSNEKDI